MSRSKNTADDLSCAVSWKFAQTEVVIAPSKEPGVGGGIFGSALVSVEERPYEKGAEVAVLAEKPIMNRARRREAKKLGLRGVITSVTGSRSCTYVVKHHKTGKEEVWNQGELRVIAELEVLSEVKGKRE